MNFQWLWTREGWTGQIKVNSKDFPKATCFMSDDTADITYKIEGGNFQRLIDYQCLPQAQEWEGNDKILFQECSPTLILAISVY